MQDLTRAEAISQYHALSFRLANARELLADDPYNKTLKREAAELRGKVKEYALLLKDRFLYDVKQSPRLRAA